MNPPHDYVVHTLPVLFWTVFITFRHAALFFRPAPYTYVNRRWIPMAELHVIHKTRITLWTTSREGFPVSLSARINLSPEQQNLTLTPSLTWYSYYKWHIVPKNKTFIHPTGTNWLTFLNILWSFKHLTSPLVEVWLNSRIGRFLSGRYSRQYRWYCRRRCSGSARWAHKNRCLLLTIEHGILRLVARS